MQMKTVHTNTRAMKIPIKYSSFSSRALGQSIPFHCIQACFVLTGSLSRKDPEKSKGSKAANPDHAEVIATEGAAAKGGYKNRKQQATRAADAKKQTDETIVPLATDQPAAAEKPAEGTPPTSACK